MCACGGITSWSHSMLETCKPFDFYRAPNWNIYCCLALTRQHGTSGKHLVQISHISQGIFSGKKPMNPPPHTLRNSAQQSQQLRFKGMQLNTHCMCYLISRFWISCKGYKVISHSIGRVICTSRSARLVLHASKSPTEVTTSYAQLRSIFASRS
jgi:hypothetical protein